MTRGQRATYHVSRLALGGAFLYAGVLKAHDVTAFAAHVAAYQLLPYSLNYLVAATLPWVEILSGALLLANRHVRAATLVLAALTSLFILVLASVLVRGLGIDCGCFGSSGSTSPGQALVRDLLLLGAAHLTFHLRGAFRPERPA